MWRLILPPLPQCIMQLPKGKQDVWWKWFVPTKRKRYGPSPVSWRVSSRLAGVEVFSWGGKGRDLVKLFLVQPAQSLFYLSLYIGVIHNISHRKKVPLHWKCTVERNSLAVRQLGLGAFTVGACGQSPVAELRSLCHTACPSPQKKKPGRLLEVIRYSYSVTTKFCTNCFSTPQDVSIPEI